MNESSLTKAERETLEFKSQTSFLLTSFLGDEDHGMICSSINGSMTSFNLMTNTFLNQSLNL